MHLKAIMIKERLLGPNDFEVGLSIGPLASLYNYHMNLYTKAIPLYERSIKISELNSFISPCTHKRIHSCECRLHDGPGQISSVAKVYLPGKWFTRAP